jgi:hypothetical protein
VQVWDVTALCPPFTDFRVNSGDGNIRDFPCQ